MATVQLAQLLYIGLFADTRPVSPTLGSRIVLYDTGGVEIWDGTAWRSVPGEAASENHIGEVSGNMARVAVEFTRPANTTAYTAGDVVSNSASATVLMEFANFARVASGSGYIVKARLTTDQKSITPRCRVHLFNASDPTLSVDNAGWQDKYAEEAKITGTFDLPPMQTGTDTSDSTQSWAEDAGLRVPFIAAANKSIYAVLEALDGFTPTSGEKFTLTLVAERN